VDLPVALNVVLSANGGSVEGSIEKGTRAAATLIPSDPRRRHELKVIPEQTTDRRSPECSYRPRRLRQISPIPASAEPNRVIVAGSGLGADGGVLSVTASEMEEPL
jgi:hypothetical protein